MEFTTPCYLVTLGVKPLFYMAKISNKALLPTCYGLLQLGIKTYKEISK